MVCADSMGQNGLFLHCRVSMILVVLELSGLLGHFRGPSVALEARPSKDGRFPSLKNISEPDVFLQ